MANSWHKLDNASKLFNAVATETNSAVFRVSATLALPVDSTLLQDVLNQTMLRFPAFGFGIKNGVFWNYLEENNSSVKVQKETSRICAPFQLDGYQRHLIRVLYYHDKLSLEVSHIMSDGAGALEFFKVLLFYYLEATGEELNDQDFRFKLDDAPQPSEWQDAYKKYATKANKSVPLANAYQIKGRKSRETVVIHGSLEIADVKKSARHYGVTVTGFLASVLIYSVYQTAIEKKQAQQTVAISIPVNLRGFFPSMTLTNFFGAMTVSVTGTRDTSFVEIVSKVKEQLVDQLKKERLQQMISENVELEETYYAKFAPLVIKEKIVKIGFARKGEAKKTITFSNLGHFNVPTSLRKAIKAINVVSYPTKNVPINCSLISYNQRMTMTFVKSIDDVTLIHYFFKYLSTVETIKAELTIH